MNNLTLEEQLESRDFCSPTSGVLNKTCDPCRSRKIKCDGGFPECSECEARKKKNRGKHFQCSYSFRKRAERRRKSDESSPQNIQVEEAQALSELTNLRHPNINTSHLKCCVETLQHLLPILNNEEISLAGFEELKHEQVERCGVGFWACLAIGAFLEGDVPQAKQMYDNACSLLLLVDNSISPASFISSQLLICLFLKMTGEGRSAGHFLKSAEKASENCSEYQAIVAAFKLAFMSVETYAEVAFSFEIDDMPNFTFDSKIYFYYRSLLQQHTLSGFFNQFSQARECYQMFLLAEEHTHASGLILKSPNNWVRLQPFLILLELCHIGMPMEALKRARRLTLFFATEPRIHSKNSEGC